MRSSFKAKAWLCLLLMLGSAWASAVHNHANEAKAASCQVCVAAHSTVSTRISVCAKPVFRRLHAADTRTLDAQQQLLIFALFIRPPPIS